MVPNSLFDAASTNSIGWESNQGIILEKEGGKEDTNKGVGKRE